MSIGVKVGFSAVLDNLRSADLDRFAVTADLEPGQRSHIEDYRWAEICHYEHADETD